MDSTKRDVRELQSIVFNSALYGAVEVTEQKLRHRVEYDIGSVDDRKFALLCYALEHSAEQSSGTSINLAGAFRVLEQLRRQVE